MRDPAVKDGDGNPFLAFNTDYYWKWISEHPPAYAPGTTAALGKAAGKPYRDLCRSIFCIKGGGARYV